MSAIVGQRFRYVPFGAAVDVSVIVDGPQLTIQICEQPKNWKSRLCVGTAPVYWSKVQAVISHESLAGPDPNVSVARLSDRIDVPAGESCCHVPHVMPVGWSESALWSSDRDAEKYQRQRKIYEQAAHHDSQTSNNLRHEFKSIHDHFHRMAKSGRCTIRIFKHV